jgi:hypothetical protein
MATFRNILASLFIFAYGAALAQVTGAKVLAVQGDVKLQRGMDVRTAVPGMPISSDESIVVSESSYVSLVHKTGQTRELREEGQYQLNKLVSGNVPDEKGLKTMMYADYVIGKMTPEGKKNRLDATGYFVKTRMRGPQRVHLHIPSAGKFYNSNPIISWEDDGSKIYHVEIRNMYQDILKEVDVSNNQIRLDLDDDLMYDESTLLIKVYTEESESELYAMRRLNGAQELNLLSELESIGNSGKSPADKFLMAGLYEYHNLLTDAHTCYLEAMKAAPDVVIYREAYEEFLLRNHLIRF